MVAAGDPFASIELTVEARVGNETILLRKIVVQSVYDDPIAKSAIEQSLRVELMYKILEKWKPKIKVTSSSRSPW